MKGKRMVGLLCLTAIVLATLLYATTALAAPEVSNFHNNNPTGTVTRMQDVTISFDLSGVDFSVPYGMGISVSFKRDDNTLVKVEQSITPTANGTVSATLKAGDLNNFPAGSFAIYLYGGKNDLNAELGPTKIGTLTIKKPPFSIKINYSKGGYAYADHSDAFFQDPIFINAVPDKGYYFVRWSIDDGHPELRNVGVPNLAFNMPSESISLYALFRPNDASVEDDSYQGDGSNTNNAAQQSSWTTNKLTVLPTVLGQTTGIRLTPITATVREDNTQLYSIPGVGVQVVGQLPKNTQVTIGGYSEGYFQALLANRKAGFIQGDALDMAINPAMAGVLLQQADLFLQGSDQVAQTLPAGSQLSVTGRQGTDWLISYNGQTYALPAAAEDSTLNLALGAQDLSALAASYAFPTTATIRDGGVNVREEANSTSKRIGILQGGDIVTAVGLEGSFMVIARNDGSIGYISADYADIVFSPALYGTLTANASVYSRRNANASYFVQSLPQGSVVSLQAREGTWCRITVEGQTLYIKAQFVSLPTIK